MRAPGQVEVHFSAKFSAARFRTSVLSLDGGCPPFPGPSVCFHLLGLTCSQVSIWKEQCPPVSTAGFPVHFYIHTRDLGSFRLLPAGLNQSAPELGPGRSELGPGCHPHLPTT